MRNLLHPLRARDACFGGRACPFVRNQPGVPLICLAPQLCAGEPISHVHIAKLRFLDRALRRFSVLHAPSFLISRTQREPPAAVPFCYVVAATGQGLASQECT